MKDTNWFNEEWACKTSKLTRDLVRSYLKAYDAAWYMPYPFGLIHAGPLRGRKKLLVVGAFVRDAVVQHLRINLRPLKIIKERSLVVSHPVHSELSLGIKKTASPEKLERAKNKLQDFEEKREKIYLHLNEAANDIEAIEKLLSGYKSTARQVFGHMLNLIQRISPIAFFTWIGAQIQALSEMPLWHGIGLCFAWILGYHFLGLLGLPFHDADYRKYILFDGYIGKPEDGIRPLLPPISRLEIALFDHLAISRPIVVSWETLVPGVHYFFTIGMVLASVIFLPLGSVGRIVASTVGLLIIVHQISHIIWWHRFLMQRYKGISFMRIITAPLY